MKNIRLLPVVVMAISALLVLKTLGLVTNGGYVLGGVSVAQASGAAAPAAAPAGAEGDATPSDGPTLEDSNPVLADPNPTLAPGSEEAAAAGGHGAPTAGEAPAEAEHAAVEGEHAATAAASSGTYCAESDATLAADGTVTFNNPPAAEGAEAEAEAPAEGEAAPAEGEAAAADHGAPAEPAPASFAASMTDCLPSGDAVPLQIDGKGGSIPLINTDGASLSEQQLLERLAARRTSLEKYEQDLALRASIVDAAEKRIEERAATLQALETQISTLVDQRTEMETGQFAGIVAMYETMKPKDAASIFNNLDMEVLLRVAKTMSPRKMAPILAVMDTARAQELTVKMADLADQPATEMTPDDLAALPQIVGQ